MDKEYFVSISDVSKRLSVPAHTLRYWEKQFPVAIRPTTGAGGRRYYRAETVQRIAVIKDLLYSHGVTIAGVKKMLQNGDFPDSADIKISSSVALSDSNAVSASGISDAVSLLQRARDLLV